jgi:prepilin-type N-terminal cleavage/methylation domain-containing protein
MNAFATKPEQQGFTIVEVIVTLVVLSLFLTGFFQAYLLLESQRINVVRQAKASDIAYVNLGKYPAKPANLSCTPTSKSTGTILGSTKSGRTTATYNFVAETDTTLLGTTSQEIIAYAPNDCDSTTPTAFKGGMVKIVSTVEYSGNRSVQHVTYVQ